MLGSSIIRALAAAAVGALSPHAVAQTCGGSWLPGEGIPGVDSYVYALSSWDPDGDGPQAAGLVAGGPFRTAGELGNRNLAFWDGQQWTSAQLNNMLSGVRTLFLRSNGQLLAGGTEPAGTSSRAGLIAWNGSEWIRVPLSIGGGEVWDLDELSSGQLVVAVGGVVIEQTPTGWETLGASNSTTNALVVLSNDQVVVGGRFLSVGGVNANHIARWDGSAWHPLGSGMNGDVYGLAALPNGDVYAAGEFSTAGGVPALGVAKWDGAQWSALGTGIDHYAYCVTATPDAQILLGGAFHVAGELEAEGIARWTGNAWAQLHRGVGGSYGATVTAVCSLPDGGVATGGSFKTAGASVAKNIAVWKNDRWSTLGTGFEDFIFNFQKLSDGSVIGYGRFAGFDSTASGGIARFDGERWRPLGTGLNNEVRAAAEMTDGSIIAGGYFTAASGIPMPFLARWDGAQWSPFSAGINTAYTNQSVDALLGLPNGTAIVGGSIAIEGTGLLQKVARWNGTRWVTMGSGWTGPVTSLGLLANGDILGIGNFGTSAMARWNGTTWTAVGPAPGSYTYETLIRPSGEVLAATEAGVKRWNGNAWSLVGTGPTMVKSIALANNGDLLAGTDTDVYRWDGVQWFPLSANFGSPTTSTGVYAVTQIVNGDILAGGVFTTVNGAASAYFARWRPNTAPVIVRGPSAESICSDGSAALTVDAGGGALAYQWQIADPGAAGGWRDLVEGTNAGVPGGEIGAAGVTNATLVVSGFADQPEDPPLPASASFRVRITNGCGEAVSDAAIVSIALCTGCNPDYNNDGGGDNADIIDLAGDIAAGTQSYPPHSPDFNNDGGADNADVIDLANVVAGAPCP